MNAPETLVGRDGWRFFLDARIWSPFWHRGASYNWAGAKIRPLQAYECTRIYWRKPNCDPVSDVTDNPCTQTAEGYTHQRLASSDF